METAIQGVNRTLEGPARPYPGYVLHKVDEPLFELKEAPAGGSEPAEQE
jgi:hypothetical protein